MSTVFYTEDAFSLKTKVITPTPVASDSFLTGLGKTAFSYMRSNAIKPFPFPLRIIASTALFAYDVAQVAYDFFYSEDSLKVPGIQRAAGKKIVENISSLLIDFLKSKTDVLKIQSEESLQKAAKYLARNFAEKILLTLPLEAREAITASKVDDLFAKGLTEALFAELQEKGLSSAVHLISDFSLKMGSKLFGELSPRMRRILDTLDVLHEPTWGALFEVEPDGAGTFTVTLTSGSEVDTSETPIGKGSVHPIFLFKGVAREKLEAVGEFLQSSKPNSSTHISYRTKELPHALSAFFGVPFQKKHITTTDNALFSNCRFLSTLRQHATKNVFNDEPSSCDAAFFKLQIASLFFTYKNHAFSLSTPECLSALSHIDSVRTTLRETPRYEMQGDDIAALDELRNHIETRLKEAQIHSKKEPTAVFSVLPPFVWKAADLFFSSNQSNSFTCEKIAEGLTNVLGDDYSKILEAISIEYAEQSKQSVETREIIESNAEYSFALFLCGFLQFAAFDLLTLGIALTVGVTTLPGIGLLSLSIAGINEFSKLIPTKYWTAYTDAWKSAFAHCIPYLIEIAFRCFVSEESKKDLRETLSLIDACSFRATFSGAAPADSAPSSLEIEVIKEIESAFHAEVEEELTTPAEILPSIPTFSSKLLKQLDSHSVEGAAVLTTSSMNTISFEALQNHLLIWNDILQTLPPFKEKEAFSSLLYDFSTVRKYNAIDPESLKEKTSYYFEMESVQRSKLKEAVEERLTPSKKHTSDFSPPNMGNFAKKLATQFEMAAAEKVAAYSMKPASESLSFVPEKIDAYPAIPEHLPLDPAPSQLEYYFTVEELAEKRLKKESFTLEDILARKSFFEKNPLPCRESPITTPAELTSFLQTLVRALHLRMRTLIDVATHKTEDEHLHEFRACSQLLCDQLRNSMLSINLLYESDDSLFTKIRWKRDELQQLTRAFAELMGMGVVVHPPSLFRMKRLESPNYSNPELHSSIYLFAALLSKNIEKLLAAETPLFIPYNTEVTYVSFLRRKGTLTFFNEKEKKAYRELVESLPKDSIRKVRALKYSDIEALTVFYETDEPVDPKILAAVLEKLEIRNLSFMSLKALLNKKEIVYAKKCFAEKSSVFDILTFPKNESVLAFLESRSSILPGLISDLLSPTMDCRDHDESKQYKSFFISSMPKGTRREDHADLLHLHSLAQNDTGFHSLQEHTLCIATQFEHYITKFPFLLGSKHRQLQTLSTYTKILCDELIYDLEPVRKKIRLSKMLAKATISVLQKIDTSLLSESLKEALFFFFIIFAHDIQNAFPDLKAEIEPVFHNKSPDLLAATTIYRALQEKELSLSNELLADFLLLSKRYRTFQKYPFEQLLIDKFSIRFPDISSRIYSPEILLCAAKRIFERSDLVECASLDDFTLTDFKDGHTLTLEAHTGKKRTLTVSLFANSATLIDYSEKVGKRVSKGSETTLPDHILLEDLVFYKTPLYINENKEVDIYVCKDLEPVQIAFVASGKILHRENLPKQLTIENLSPSLFIPHHPYLVLEAPFSPRDTHPIFYSFCRGSLLEKFTSSAGAIYKVSRNNAQLYFIESDDSLSLLPESDWQLSSVQNEKTLPFSQYMIFENDKERKALVKPLNSIESAALSLLSSLHKELGSNIDSAARLFPELASGFKEVSDNKETPFLMLSLSSEGYPLPQTAADYVALILAFQKSSPKDALKYLAELREKIALDPQIEEDPLLVKLAYSLCLTHCISGDLESLPSVLHFILSLLQTKGMRGRKQEYLLSLFSLPLYATYLSSGRYTYSLMPESIEATYLTELFTLLETYLKPLSSQSRSLGIDPFSILESLVQGGSLSLFQSLFTGGIQERLHYLEQKYPLPEMSTPYRAYKRFLSAATSSTEVSLPLKNGLSLPSQIVSRAVTHLALSSLYHS